VPAARAEEARARMIELFPEGFEEVDHADGVELIAYTDAGGEERLWHAFGGARGAEIPGDWRERWKEFHRPVRVGPLWIGPPWDEPPGDAIGVVIDPGRAFGTGAHATTRLCIELLLEEDRCPVMDLGCGSGVLAIAAAKLGFMPVLAIDSDQNAVAATIANAAANGVSIETRHADVLLDETPPAELVLANITRQALEELGPRLRCARLVSSGYLPTDPDELAGFRLVRRVTQDGWAADLYEAAQ
jgi:ribosomal protein L11 methyltransferase